MWIQLFFVFSNLGSIERIFQDNEQIEKKNNKFDRPSWMTMNNRPSWMAMRIYYCYYIAIIIISFIAIIIYEDECIDLN